MNIQLLSKTYDVRKLDLNDIDLIYEINKENIIYYQYHPPFVTKDIIKNDLIDLPPLKSNDDKYYIGFFENNILVAHMDLILSYPNDYTALIGLFMMNIHYQNKGIGSKIIKDVCDYLKELGYKTIRIGVDVGNPQSYAFWTKNNFKVVDQTQYIVMELDMKKD